MIIWLSDQAPLELREPHDFKKFKIVVESDNVTGMNLAARLLGLADIEEDGTAWVSQGALMALADVEDRAAWELSFHAMIESVRRVGWVREGDQAVQAHIEITPPPGPPVSPPAIDPAD